MKTETRTPRTAAEARRRLAVVPDSVCACSSCQEMCQRRPCWTTPDEAQAIIDAGLGGRLMRDWWVGAAIQMPDDDERRWDDTYLLVPAMVGHEGGDCDRSWMPTGRCTFLNGGRCELHALGLKPSEGRKAIHEPQWSETITGACEYVTRWHRHHERPRSALWAIAAQRVGELDLCGVAIVGQPKSRALANGVRCEVVRIATDGSDNVCSFLYNKARRAAQALGYVSCKTYTLKSESGASLRALGLKPEAEVKGREWDTPSRRRHAGPKAQTEDKLRWELIA